ncbi:UNVERIFIED_CONTAM: hypothetical protein NCL1_49058 [Trichonephila clavipes]
MLIKITDDWCFTIAELEYIPSRAGIPINVAPHMRYQLPQYVFAYLNKFQGLIDLEDSEIVGLSTTAAKLLSTFYLCRKCIKYEPDAITAACIHFLFVYFDLNVPKLSRMLFKEFRDYADKEKACIIMSDMMTVAQISMERAPSI